MKARIFRFGVFLFSFLFGIIGIRCSEKVQSAPDSYFFLAYGRLLKVDPEEQSIYNLCSFHPAAPSVDFSPDGLYWARIGEKVLAAFNPKTGKIEAKVMLPHRPYNHIITPDGKAYVTFKT